MLDSEFVEKLVGGFIHGGLAHSEEGLVTQGLSVVSNQEGGDVEGVVSSSDIEAGVVVPESIGPGDVGLS